MMGHDEHNFSGGSCTLVPFDLEQPNSGHGDTLTNPKGVDPSVLKIFWDPYVYPCDLTYSDETGHSQAFHHPKQLWPQCAQIFGTWI